MNSLRKSLRELFIHRLLFLFTHVKITRQWKSTLKGGFVVRQTERHFSLTHLRQIDNMTDQERHTDILMLHTLTSDRDNEL